jgi:hypothetical protein
MTYKDACFLLEDGYSMRNFSILLPEDAACFYSFKRYDECVTTIDFERTK